FLRDQCAAVEFYGETAFGPLIKLLGHPFKRDGSRFWRRDDVRPQKLLGRSLREDRSAAGGEDAGKTGTSPQRAAAGTCGGQVAGRHAFSSSLHFLFCPACRPHCAAPL